MRPRLRALSAAGVLCLVSACAPAPDEQVLTRFFEASRTLDSVRLDRFATVVFNPRTDGSIQRFSVTDRGADRRRSIDASNREAAVRSLAASQRQDIDLSDASVGIIERDITVEAEVRAPGGAVGRGVLIVTLERAVGTRAGVTIEGQWIVTRLQRAPAERTSRAVSSGPPS